MHYTVKIFFKLRITHAVQYSTAEPRFNKPLHNEVLGLTNDTLQFYLSYNKMYGTEPPYSEPRYNEILVTTNTIQKPKRIIFPDETNKGQHVTKDECEIDQRESKSFNSVKIKKQLHS